MADFKQDFCKESDLMNMAPNHHLDGTPMHYFEFLRLHLGKSLSESETEIWRKPSREKAASSPPIQPHFNFPKKFTCDICKKGLRCRSDLRYHIRVHLFGRPFKCPHCELTYATKSAFELHVQRHALKCNFCPMTFTEKKKLSRHAAKSHPHKCIVCQLEFFYRVEMAMHFCASHNGRMMPSGVVCTLCGVLFGTVEFGRHLEKKYQCRVCKQRFTCFKLYTKHRDEERMRAVRCCSCARYVHDLQAHFAGGSCVFQQKTCKFCGVKFPSARQLMKHNQAECEMSCVSFQCKFCKRSFFNKCELGHHLNKEHGTASCKHCGRKYMDSNLAHHESICRRRHYRCILCPEVKVFNSRESCFRHLNFRHANTLKQTPFTCARCKRCTASKRKLLVHIVECYSINKN